MEASTIAIIISAIVLVGVAGFAVYGILSIGSNPVPATPPVQPDQVQPGVTGQTVPVVNGIQSVNLTMDNYNYYPDTIIVKRGIPVKITMSSNVQGCYRSLIIPSLNLSKVFSSEGDYLEFTPQNSGTIPFSCSMGMGRGKIIVQ